MRLYAGLSAHFIRDTVQNQIAGKLADAFFRHYRYEPPKNEVASWRNSLRAICQVLQATGMTANGVILEYQLPLTSRRLDCLLCGRTDEAADAAVIIELKQWDGCEPADGDGLVTTWLGRGHRATLHPAVQAQQYQLYLQDTSTVFYEEPAPVSLSSCAYLHNYFREDPDCLFDAKFAGALARTPTFTADDVDDLMEYLSTRLAVGDEGEVLERIEGSRYRPSKKLMEHVGNLIKGLPEYVLLDEQLVVNNQVMVVAEKGFHDRRKTVILVRGGPGTGKSVIAMNLVGDLLLKGYNAHYATGSRAFTETLRAIIGRRGSAQFKYFNSYMHAEGNEVDVLICDEAHRIRETSATRFMRKDQRTGKPQVDELMDVAKVAVFFIDDRQLVRPDEIGSAELILERARTRGALVHEHQLHAQFRCAGSEGFVLWIENTLGIARTPHVLWDGAEGFDFRIMGSVAGLDDQIRALAAVGHSARMTAGFCWPWSKPNSDGELVDDVVVGDFRRPWNARPEARRLAAGVPKATLWAHDPAGLDQVGCVYTAQGFEFDYVGVIFGLDLRYDFDSQAWEGDASQSYDTAVRRAKEGFAELVKNTYRVLLSRGLKGCYVYFMDRDTERFFRSRIDTAARYREESDVERRVAEEPTGDA